MKKYDWNFICMNFEGTDAIQHKMWHHMDPSHPKHNKVLSEKYGNAILNFYQKIDEILGEILEEVDKNTIVMIFSDHGNGKAKKFIHINNFLKDIGVLKFKNDLKTLVKRLLFKLGFTPSKMFKLSTKLGLENLVGKMRKGTKARVNLVNLLKRIFLSFSDVDWKRTIAYSIGHIGQIYINVKGREPSGIINIGREYEAAREYIIKKLKSLREPERGERIIKKIYMKEEIYSGQYMDKGPDICFISKNLEYLGFGTWFGDLEFASKTTIEDCFGFTGNHKVNGILILNGNGISPQIKLNGSSLEDIAPTVLYYLGLPIPNDMDGKVLKDAFTKKFLKKNTIKFVDISKKESELKSFSKEEEEKIKEKLRKLGYIA